MCFIITGLTIGFSEALYIVNELDRTVSLSIIAFNEVTPTTPLYEYRITFTVADDTATSPADFEDPGKVNLEFVAGVTNIQVNVSIRSDVSLEDTEQFFGYLQSMDFGVILQNNMTTIRIADGDCKGTTFFYCLILMHFFFNPQLLSSTF